MTLPGLRPSLAAIVVLVAGACSDPQPLRSPPAATRYAPTPALAPDAVVRLQLEALQNNDVPQPDAGIALTWIFAHPANRRATGPLPRFAALIRSPAYRGLLNHRSHRIEAAQRTADRAAFVVRIEAQDGRRLTFGWILERSQDPACADCWLTSGVSPAQAEPPAV